MCAPWSGSPVFLSRMAIWNWYIQMLASIASRRPANVSSAIGRATGVRSDQSPWTPCTVSVNCD